MPPANVTPPTPSNPTPANGSGSSDNKDVKAEEKKPKVPGRVGRSWSQMKRRANNISNVVALIVALLVVGATIGFLAANMSKTSNNTPAKTPSVSTLSQAELQKLTDISSNLGTSNQTLNIGANALFRGNINVTNDLTVGGRFNANGPVTLSQLNITGTTALSGLNVGSNLTVAGVTTLQKGLTVTGLVAVNGGLNVSGTASVNALNAATISVREINISGPLLISHIQTQGAAPNVAAGNAVGGGGTVNISGNDTAGTVNVNTGGGTAAGVLATVVFRAAYTGGVHVLITGLTGASANLPAYVTRTSTGFQIRVDSAPASGAVFAFDYLVVQ